MKLGNCMKMTIQYYGTIKLVWNWKVADETGLLNSKHIEFGLIANVHFF